MMLKKYINLLLIPVFFTVVACTNTSKNKEGFLDFSSSLDEAKDILSFSEDEETEEKEKADLESENDQEIKVDEEIAEEVATKPKKKQKLNKEFAEFSKIFHLDYLTFDVANFYAELEKRKSTNKADYFKLTFYSKTNGFVDYLFGWMSYTVSYFKVVDNKIIPKKFKSKTKLKKKVREIEISYDKSGKIKSEKVTPPDNRHKRPAVPANLKKRIFDPLSIIIETRKMVRDAIENDHFNDRGIYKFTLPLYDARKRTDINFFLHKKKLNGLYKLELTRKPISGYTNNELEQAKEHQIKVSIYVDPVTLLPMRAEGKSLIGTAEANYISDCTKGIKDCIKEKK